MPDKPEEKSSEEKAISKPKRRGWFLGLLKWMGILLLVLAIFHRPIFHTAVRFALIQVASKQNVKLDVHFSGSIFTNLNIRDVSAVPNGKGPSPVERIAIESVRLDYSIPMLIKKGVGELLRSYELKNATIILRPQPSKDEATKEQKKSLAEDLNNLLGQPALYADAVNIEHFTITILGADGTITEVNDLNLLLNPWEPGHLKIGKVSVPGLPVWQEINATTSYAKRNLYIRDIKLSPELVITELNFDASRRAEDKGSLHLETTLFGGGLNFTLAGSQLKARGENLQRSYDTHLKIDAGNIDIKKATAYFGAKEAPVARLGWLSVAFKGEPEKPRTWEGQISLRAEDIAAGPVPINGIEAYLDIAKGIATLKQVTADAASSAVKLDAVATLPESINGLSQTEGDANFEINAPDLTALSSLFSKEPIGGTLKTTGSASLHSQVAKVNLQLTSSEIGTREAAASSVAVQVAAAKRLDLPKEAPALEGLTGSISAQVKEISYSAFTIDQMRLEGSIENDLATLRSLEVIRGSNKVAASGTYRLPRQSEKISPLEAQFSIEAPALEEFRIGVKDQVVSGPLSVSGELTTKSDSYGGSIQMQGGPFQFGDFTAAKLGANIKVVNNEALVEQFALNINGTDQIATTGKLGLPGEMPYEGALLVLFKDVAALQPLLTTLDISESIGGSFDVSIESQGKLKESGHSGSLKVNVAKAHYGAVQLSEFRLATIFAPNFVESSDFHAALGATTFDAKIAWKEGRASLKEINLMQGTQQALSGYVLLPLDPTNKEQPVPLDQRIGVNLNAKDLDLTKLGESLGKPLPVSGNLSMNFLVAGTALKPTAHLKLGARSIKSPAAAKFDAAEVDLTAHYSEKELTLDLAARQKEIQPLVVKGHIPLDVEATLQSKSIDPSLPIDLTVNLPPSSLAFVPKVVPAVRSISGKAGMNAHVSGTLGKPILSGAADVSIEYARMNSGGIPNIGAFQLGLNFTENSVGIRRIHGELGGGTFDVSGKVLLPKLNEPAFDLQIKSDEVLVKRDESVTVRVDTDISVTGPLAAGLVKGNVYVTHSRFFREIDILPVALPGRPKPKPQPKSVPTQATIALGPPLDKWTFDIAIKTRPDDPFLVRGNLANGGASVDLKFAGTGAEPTLEGIVRVDNLVATLPFSKLNVTRGFVTFSKDAMLQPVLDIVAESDIREYHINLAVYGKASDPQLSLTSEPPLAQQDLLSLLATGTTLSELTGNSDVLAGRAASLLFQQLYRKVFKKKDSTENVPILNRFEVEVGTTDNRTGRQAIGGSFKINDNVYILGNMNVAGDFIGRVRYLLRFR